jgi:hypothetical protein
MRLNIIVVSPHLYLILLFLNPTGKAGFFSDSKEEQRPAKAHTPTETLL